MADFGANDAVVAFGADDAVVTQEPSPVSANDILVDGPMFGASPEQIEATRNVLSPEDMDIQTYIAYSSAKMGTNFTPEMAEANIKFEYGDNATAGTANSENKKPINAQRRAIRKLSYEEIIGVASGDVPEGYEDVIDEPPEDILDLAKDLDELMNDNPSFAGLVGRQLDFNRSEMFRAKARQGNVTGSVFDHFLRGGWDASMANRYSAAGSDRDKIKELQREDLDISGIADQEMDLSEEGFGGKILKGTSGAMIPILENVISAGAVGQIPVVGPWAGKIVSGAYWQQQGAGSFKRAFYKYADVDSLSDEQLDQINTVSQAMGVPYAIIEYAVSAVPGMKSLGSSVDKVLARAIINRLANNPTLMRRVATEGVAFGLRVAIESLFEEGAQGGVDEATAQMLDKVEAGNLAALFQYDWESIRGRWKEEGVAALPATIGIQAIFGGASAVNRFNKTRGDFSRIRQRNSDEQIDAMVDDGTLSSEEGIVAKNPTEEAYDNYLSAEEEAFVTEAMETAARVKGREEVVGPAAEEITTEEVEIIGLEEAMSADKTDEQKQEAVREQLSDIVGVSKNWDKVESAIPFDETVLEPERIKQTETIKAAFDKGLHTKTDEIVQKVKKKKAITHEEVGGLLIRKAEIVQTIDQISKDMAQATIDGNDDLIAVLGQELNEQIELGIEITETARKGATEVARSLAAMAMQMDKKTFDLVNVTSLAQATKGENLTQEESESIKEKVTELEAIEVDIEKAETGELDEREAIIDEVERAHRRLKKAGRKKADKNADVKLIRKRQDQIFALIEEINQGKPKGEKIKKVAQPDSEGYLEMLTNLRKELSEVRKERRLDEQIAQMEEDLRAGDISKYADKSEKVAEAYEIMLKRARKIALQKEINRQIADLKPRTVASVASDVWDVFRNLKLTADMGHLLRQGGVVMSNPKMWKGGAQQFFRESMKALVKEKADVIDATIMSHKNYDKWKLAGLAFIEEGQQLDAREEILMNGILGKAPLGIGTAQKAFGRTQITGTNLLRLLAAESYSGGKDLTLDEMKDVAFAVNVLTGRGATVKDQRVNKVLNKILTSPSFTASRFQAPFLLAHKHDGKYLWENKQLRKRIIEDSAWFIGTRLALMAAIAAALPDAEMGEDPDHWTYGRLIVDVGGGQSRVYDPWAGIQSTYRAIYPFVKGEATLGDTVGKILEGRKHPAISALQEIRTGETFYGEEIGRKAAIVRSILPISIEGVREAIEEDTGIFDLISAVSTDIVGIGSTLVDTDDLRKSRERAEKD